MPIGTSDGEYFDNHFEAMVGSGVTAGLKRIPIVKDPEVIPGTDPGDYRMVRTPQEITRGRELDQTELDPSTGLGIEIGWKNRIPQGFDPATLAARMPPEASRKPADALKSEEATRVAPPNKFDFSPKYETQLTPDEEVKFQDWKKVNAPNDSGFDYDLRGAFKAGVTPDAKTGHWPDTYKKPNHPTFSDQSQYAKDRPDLAGHWDGETYYPAPYGLNPPEGITKVLDEFKSQARGDPNAKIVITPEDLDTAIKVGLGVGPGLMAGVKSKALPRDMLYKAQNMELEGAHADDIWKETGFGRGADNRWKYEINDRAADMNMSAFEMTPASVKSMTTKASGPKGWSGIEGDPWYQLKTTDVNPKLKDVFNHPELYKAYPELADISVTKVPGMQLLAGIKGYYDPTIKQLAVSAGTLDQTRSIILHEIQHIIQSTEGFSTGANMQVFKTKQWKDLEDAFKANKKEITDIISEYFPNNPRILSDLKYALMNAEHLPHAEEFAAKGYKYAAENAKRIRDGLELLDQVPPLKESIERIIKGEKLVDEMQAKLFKEYQAVKGEVESRNVQQRRNMTAEERRKLAPEHTEDVKRSQQRWSPFDPAGLKDLQ